MMLQHSFPVRRVLLVFCIALACAAGVLLASGAKAAFADSANLAAADIVSMKPADTQTAKAQKAVKISKKRLRAFKKATNDFSIELFKRCVDAKGKNANVTVSPISVMTALAMTANGANGATSRQLRNVLAGGASTTDLDKNLRWFNKHLYNGKKAQLKSANSIWYHNTGSLKMKRKFLAVNKKYLDAEVRPADFSKQSTVDSINGWVSDKTNGMIKNVIGDLSPEDKIALINALYFEAKWLSPYTKDDVHNATFTTASGKKKTVKMMYGDESKYIEGEGVTGFVKPYAKGYSFVALLPDEGTSAKEFASTLTGDKFAKLVTGATRTQVRTGLPKYSVNYTNDSMEKQLQAMGVKTAFDPDRANFKRMGTDPEGNLYIGQVIHKTRVDVDEEGTKAAAVTAVMVKANSAFPIEKKEVILNRPFVYAIVDNSTNLPLFIGTVSTISK